MHMCHTARKVSESGNMHESMVQLYGEGSSRSFETDHSYNGGQDSTVSFGQTSSDVGKSFILPGPFASKADVGVIPTGDRSVLSTFHPVEKGVKSFVLMGQTVQCSSVPSIGLPLVHQVSQSGNMPQSMVQLYGEGSSRSFESSGPSYNSGQDSTVSFGRTSSNVDKSFILPGAFASKADGNFTRNINNEGAGVIPMVDLNDKGHGNVSSKGVESFVLFGQSIQKADCDIFSVTPSSNKGQESFMSLPSSKKVPESLVMTESNYREENANVLSGGPSSYTEGRKVAFMVSSQDSAEKNNDRVSPEDRRKTVSLGDHQKEGSSVRGTNSNENSSRAPATAKDPLHMEAKGKMSSKSGNPLNATARANTSLVRKRKDPKNVKKCSTKFLKNVKEHSTTVPKNVKEQSTTFPKNVRELLSTGILDGVHVKFYSWSREQNLCGIIQGNAFLCGCNDCNFNNAVPAYTFEKHANGKTVHPNNYIYFANGKTVYAVAQELRNTPREKLFDAIQTITGSEINHENFRTWKAAYLQLQCIYAKEDAVNSAS